MILLTNFILKLNPLQESDSMIQNPQMHCNIYSIIYILRFLLKLNKWSIYATLKICTFMHGRKSLISFTEFIKLLQMYSLCICFTTMQWRTTTIAVVILKPIWSTRKPDPALEMNLPAPESEDQSPATNPCVAALSGSSASLSEQSIGDVRKSLWILGNKPSNTAYKT